MLSTATVEGISVPGGGWTFLGLMEVAKRVLIRVDLPRPDSPDEAEGAGARAAIVSGCLRLTGLGSSLA